MTNNKQQTAMEWFLDQLIEHRIIIVDKTTYQVKYKHEILLEQAKEMDKEQKIRDFTDGYLYRGEQLRPWLIDKWYNETYGGSEQ
jgi:hypothetical protein